MWQLAGHASVPSSIGACLPYLISSILLSDPTVAGWPASARPLGGCCDCIRCSTSYKPDPSAGRRSMGDESAAGSHGTDYVPRQRCVDSVAALGLRMRQAQDTAFRDYPFGGGVINQVINFGSPPVAGADRHGLGDPPFVLSSRRVGEPEETLMPLQGEGPSTCRPRGAGQTQRHRPQ